MVIAEFGSAFVLTFMVLLFHRRLERMGMNFVVVAFIVFILGYFIPRLLFKYIIPAKCPKCGGRSIFHGGRPVTYNCRACGYVHTTKAFE